ncbi:MAG: hypothetical protein II851_02540 [Bacteroidales bacterium]|nr:hypothetical protein [Bacteroidales bacterium]
MSSGTNEIILALIAIVASPLTAWLTSVLMKAKSNQEVARLKAEVEQMKADVRSRELDNDRKAIETMMELVVNPLRREMESLRRKMDRLTHAIEKIPSCPHSDNCPVSRELQRNADPYPGDPGPARGKGVGRRNRKDPGGPAVHPGGNKDPDDECVQEV